MKPLVLIVVALLAPLAAQAVDWSSGVAYEYDGAGNIRRIGTDPHVYDVAGRLVQSDINGVRRKFDYDAYGNRTACIPTTGSCQPYQIDSQTNRILGGTYEGGNLTALGQHSFAYDAVNMQTREVGTVVREYVYTADDERIAIYDANGRMWLWSLRDASGKVLRDVISRDPATGTVGTASWQWAKDYAYRDGQLLATKQIEPGAATASTYHYHLDHLGTPRRITDATHRIIGEHNYHAFGPRLSAGDRQEPSPNRLEYTGHERDGELDYMHARYYDWGMGRFLSVDPGRDWDPKQPQSWNMYAYVRNNPINRTDPTGRCATVASTYQCAAALRMIGEALYEAAASSGIGKLFRGAQSGDMQLAKEGQVQLDHEIITALLVTGMAPGPGSRTVSTTVQGEAWVTPEAVGAMIGSRVARQTSGKMSTIATEITNAGMSQADAASAVNSAVKATGLRTTDVVKVGKDLVVGSVAPGTNKPVLVINTQGVVRQATATIEPTRLGVAIKDIEY